MSLRKLVLSAVAAAIVSAGGPAFALGFRLGETKDELKLDYEVSAVDHGTGRVTVVLTIADEGRLKPLDSVDLVIPQENGTGFVDLSVPLALTEEGGRRTARVHLRKDWADRAELQLKTSTLDGKKLALTWYYHAIPIAGVPATPAKK